MPGASHAQSIVNKLLSNPWRLSAKVGIAMPAVSRSTVQAFYLAYVTRDSVRIEPLLDDDVEWMISGPVDVLPFCGQRRGKTSVLEIFDRLIPETFEITGFEPQSLLIDGDRVAMMSVLSAVTQEHSRKISYRVAHFMRFRNDKVVEFCSIIDSFDAAEQVLGHSIDVSQQLSERDLTAAGDLIMV
jgi:ketosteroid isomerase-like protein